MGTAFWAAKFAFFLVVLASTALLVRLAVPHSWDLLLSTVPRLCASLRRYLVPPYIFFVVNFMILIILKLPDTKNHNHSKESPAATAAAANPPKPPKDLPHLSAGEVSPNVWSVVGPFPSAPVSSPKAGDSFFSAWSDESSLTADFEGDSAASPPPATAVVTQNTVEVGVRPLDEPLATVEAAEEDDHDSLDATWRAITGGEPGRRQLKKNETWSSPPTVQLEPGGGPAGRRELSKSETFRQSSSATRRVMVETRVNRREGPVAEDHDDINRLFEAFIKKRKDQMRLQREESAAQRYREMVNSPGY